MRWPQPLAAHSSRAFTARFPLDRPLRRIMSWSSADQSAPHCYP
jgi:hypothetical protein